MDVGDLFNRIKSSGYSGQRYITRNGKRFTKEEFDALPPEKKEELEMSDEDYASLDRELNTLEKEWKNEIDPLKRDVLLLKYDLTIESFGFVEDPKLIMKLKDLIKQYENSIMKRDGRKN
jgi:DNA repair exonuclease SbcCD nuclease subunit